MRIFVCKGQPKVGQNANTPQSVRKFDQPFGSLPGGFASQREIPHRVTNTRDVHSRGVVARRPGRSRGITGSICIVLIVQVLSFNPKTNIIFKQFTKERLLKRRFSLALHPPGQLDWNLGKLFVCSGFSLRRKGDERRGTCVPLHFISKRLTSMLEPCHGIPHSKGVS